MSDPAWAWYEDDGTTPAVAPSLAPLNGVATDPVTLRLYNDIDGSAGSVDSEDFLLTILSRPKGVGEYTMEDDLSAGGYGEIRLTDYGGTGMLPQTSSWTSVGGGRYLSVRSIKAEGYRTIEHRFNVPLGVGVLAKDYRIAVIENQRTISLDMGHYEGGAQGVRLGLGDGSFTHILSGFEIEEAGTPDNTVNVLTGAKVIEGVPSVNMEEVLTFNDEDSDAQALLTGEEYLVLVSVDETNAATATKGFKGTSPLSETYLPALPDGHREIGWLRVPFSAVITQSEINQDGLLYGCAKLVGSGLNHDVHPFEAVMGNTLIIVPSPIPITLVDDDVNYVWLSPSAAITVNQDGLQPMTRSQLLYEVTVASGVVTEVVDCRHFLYPNPVEVHLYRQGTLAGAQVFYGVLPTASQAYLLPIGGIVAAVGDRGGASGSTLFDVFATDRDNTYVTLFTDSGTQEERPEIAYNATNPIDTGSIPQVLSFHGGARFKGSVVSVPGTASVDAMLTLRFSAVGAA